MALYNFERPDPVYKELTNVLRADGKPQGYTYNTEGQLITLRESDGVRSSIVACHNRRPDPNASRNASR
ncbi:MAG: hypothetical protein KDI89_06775, partial [Gammaproteobacteria bacterium]|nr:hypothetical protein [Gammaproteobacteria bacterium]